MNTNPPPLKKRRRLRWWRPLGYLLLSLFLWWGVNKLLEPQPVWSLDSTDGKGVKPVFEQENGPYLLATEFSDNPWRTLALLVLDKQTGQVLHRLPTSDPELRILRHLNNVPRIHGDVIWRMSVDEHADGIDYRLYAWKFKKENTEKAVRVWKEREKNTVVLHWPRHSPIILIQHRWTLELKIWKNLLNSWLTFVLGKDFNNLVPELPAWIEAWHLPETPEQEVEKLSQWKVPHDRLDAVWEFSDDGKRAVVLESGGDRQLAEKRALASGKQLFLGKELFNVLRSGAEGMKLYDTTTGKCLLHYQDECAPYSAWGWRGPYLITGVVNPVNITTELFLNDLLRRDIEWMPREAKLMNPFQRNIYRVDDQGIHPVAIPQHAHDTGVHFTFQGNLLQGGSRECYYIDNDQLKTLHKIQLSKERRGYFSWLPVSSGHQYLTITTSPWRYSLEAWAKKWRVLNWGFEKIKDQQWVNQDVCVVHDDQPGQQREQSFDLFSEISQHHTFSKLFLRKIHMTDIRTITGSTLYAYELPMQIHSPWWARTAALLPWLWLIWTWFRRYSLSKFQERRDVSPPVRRATTPNSPAS